MKKAIKLYKTGAFGLNAICKRYQVPKPTFKRHLLGTNVKAKEGLKSLGRVQVFSTEVEQELENQILKMEEIFFGLTIQDIRRAAYQFAEKNGIKHNFNKVKGTAGKAWFYNFMKSHPKVSLRQPESTSLARCKGFNRQNVNHFFDILEKLVDQYKIDATRIYNVDESGFSTVQKKCQKIIAKKGKKNVGAVASGERGVNTTFIVSTNAAGNFVAPMIIFKRKRMMPELAEGARPGCLVQISDTGYINTELFVVWLHKFIEVVKPKPTPEDRVILVLDGHTTHSKNLEAINLARQHGVILLQLPGHTTNRLQPLDVAIFKPMEVYYDQAVERWMREHPGLSVTQHQVAKLLGEAYGKSATVGFAINGFAKTGVWPVNRHVFTDVDFAASDVLVNNSSQLPIGKNKNQIGHDEDDSSDDDIPLSKLMSKDGAPKINSEGNSFFPGSGDWGNRRIDSKNAQQQKNVDLPNISIDEIICLAGTSGLGNKPRINKNAQQAAVLTSTPYKDELENRKKNVLNEKKVQ
ncbi:unnamed protein product [Acanthoscelides obtectus]|uniref:HTH CENPB-type domain-containing protein n=1 Tax=Acanthoscelides obtectus TaxID=200917 RepID=A0A9P0P786_ACAOB|nr:unnamed protein product [Acanthoscelides obtectus]CAK1642986.1 Tigger transposable element-derived protein 1 [Acanthoscelides obtectus]